MGSAMGCPESQDLENSECSSCMWEGVGDPWVDAGISEERYHHIVCEFATLDQNHDHQLSRGEFDNAAGLPEFLGMTVEDLEHLFDNVDADHNGSISFKEFLKYMCKRKDFLPLPIQVDPQRQRLEDNMQLLGFRKCTTDNGRIGVEGDGNCQFLSLSWHLFATTTQHVTVRARVVEYMRGVGRQDFECFYAPELPSQPKTYDEYLKDMARNRTWGDHMTIRAAADVFNVRVRILTAGRYDSSASPQNGDISGHAFGIRETIIPQGEGRRPNGYKDVWVSFAARHYTPVVPTAGTPTRFLV